MPRSNLPPHVRLRVAQRDMALQVLGFKDYSAYLGSTHWSGVRRAYRESDLPQVCMCGSDEIELHHTTYDRIGAEELTDLMPLCTTCHQIVHVLERRGELGLDFSGFEDPDRAYEYWLANMERRERARDQAPPELEERVRIARDARNRWKRQKRRAIRAKHRRML